jgi:glycosyltransferase involved in cell wall biosynthesis
MRRAPRLTPETLQFVLLSFEGPDQYATAGGLGVRMKELALELARSGYTTHLIFVGDPDLPGREALGDHLTLHRWCQWLSAGYRNGVYEGEEEKLADWNATVPAFVVDELVRPAAQRGMLTAVLAEEWHTAESTCDLSDELWAAGLRDQAIILWNANNVMGFERIDWERLSFCSQITTVSRYMKHVMWAEGVNPLVVPNGIPEDRIHRFHATKVRELRAAVGSRELLFKIGRWSPDKRWLMAVEALAAEVARGHDVTMVIRGGIEPHAVEVLQRAHDLGLSIVDLRMPRDLDGAIAALDATPRAHIYNVQNFMTDELISLFYTAADAVLANSGHEPFGLVGLEVMAASGIAFVGSTGEDYAIPFLNGVVIDSGDPTEICIALDQLRSHPDAATQMRQEARATARRYTWTNVIDDILLSKLKYVALRQDVEAPPTLLTAGTTAGPTTAPTAGPHPATPPTSGGHAAYGGSLPANSVGGGLAVDPPA